MSHITELLAAAEDVVALWEQGDLAVAVCELGVCVRQAKNVDRGVQRIVEEAWLSRAKTGEYGKPSSVAYKRKEIEFFVGAMAAINAMLPSAEKNRLSSVVPVAWVINSMSGRNVVEPEK